MPAPPGGFFSTITAPPPSLCPALHTSTARAVLLYPAHGQRPTLIPAPWSQRGTCGPLGIAAPTAGGLSFPAFWLCPSLCLFILAFCLFLRSASLCVCPSVSLFLLLPRLLCCFLSPRLFWVPFHCSLVPVRLCLLLPRCFSPWLSSSPCVFACPGGMTTLPTSPQKAQSSPHGVPEPLVASSPLSSATQDHTAYEGVQHFLFSRSRVTKHKHKTSPPQKQPPPCASRPPEPTARLVPSWVGSPRPCCLPSKDTVTALTTARGLGSSPLFSGSPPWPLPTHQDRPPRTSGFPKTPRTRLALHRAPRWLPSPESHQVPCS